MQHINQCLSDKKILKIYTQRILLGCFCILSCLSCSSKVNYDDQHCSIHYYDDIKNLNCFNKSVQSLKIPPDVDFVLPKAYENYVLPSINMEELNELKSVINVCPPVISDDIYNESCLRDTQ